MVQSNFECLKEHDPIFFQLAKASEMSFTEDPNTSLIKLRQLGEAMAQDIAARFQIDFDERTPQVSDVFKDVTLELNQTFFNRAFTQGGGKKNLNKILGKQLETLLAEIPSKLGNKQPE